MCIQYSVMTMKKNASKTNYSLDCILQNSNSDYVFSTFWLNLSSIQMSMGIYHSPHTYAHGNPHTHGSPGVFCCSLLVVGNGVVTQRWAAD